MVYPTPGGAMTTKLIQADYRAMGGSMVRTANERFSAAGAMEWTRFADTQVIAQITGTATTGTVVVERSAIEPTSTTSSTYAAPADDTAFTGDLTSGVSPRVYTESGVGWWRIRVTTATAGYLDCALSGKGG